MSNSSTRTPNARRREHRAIGMLLLACLIWGMGFNWNKEGQAILGSRLAEVCGDPSLSGLGPAWCLAIRFLLVVVCWALVFRASRLGWTWTTIRAGLSGGGLLAGGMLLQHYGLSYTSESLSSFLTSLTVLFTPFLAVVFLRQRVGGWMWASVGCATVGVALMTLYRVEGAFDRGALLGLLCAVVFSAHILVVDHYGRREDARRFALAQFLTATVIFVTFSIVRHTASAPLHFSEVARAAASAPFLGWLALIASVGTFLTFGLMFRFQPDTNPTRASLIYLSEPVFATLYAWLAAASTLTSAAILGAALILLGNLLAEFLSKNAERTTPGP